MVRMFNTITQTEMYVAEDRVSEYKAMGHKVITVTPLEDLIKEAIPSRDMPKPKDPLRNTTLRDTTKKLKETIEKSKKTTRKKA